MAKIERIGLLTGGGDCPGLNAVIRGVAKSAIYEHGLDVIGIEDGFAGLLEHRVRRLTSDDVSGILARGGTILGASNRDNPFRVRIAKDRYEDHSEKVLQTLKKEKIDALVCAGGDGTMSISQKLCELGVSIIGLPKTIDNDLMGTDQTFGFDTAVSVIADAVDRVHFTAESHDRVLIVETMGRYAGWLALGGGIAGGADIILLPEIPYEMEAITKAIRERKALGRSFTIICVAEGAHPKGGDVSVQNVNPNRTDPITLGGIGQKIGAEIERATGQETRTVVLGYLQRGGSPTAYDRLLGTSFGVKAIEMLVAGETGRMACLRGGEIQSVPLSEVAGKTRTVPLDHHWVRSARSVGTSFGTGDL